MRCVRVRFSKSGDMIYISHLDINRMMTRAVRRAHLPMWYTEGFNPHPYIAFALPLPLGQSSECEFMDIRIEGDMTNAEVLEKLRSVMPQGVGIVSAEDPVHSANEINKAQYSVTLDFSSEEQAEQFCSEAQKLLGVESLIAQKTGKKGHRKVLKEVNLIEQIFDWSVSADGDSVKLNLTLAAGNTVNLNPALLIETLQKHTGVDAEQQHIVRQAILTADGEEFC